MVTVPYFQADRSRHWAPMSTYSKTWVKWQLPKRPNIGIQTNYRERSGSVVECLTRDRKAAGPSLTGVTALWSLSKLWHIYPSLVLVQPRKTRHCLTERLLIGRKESNKKKRVSLNAGQKGAFCNPFDLHYAIICHRDLCFAYFWVTV